MQSIKRDKHFFYFFVTYKRLTLAKKATATNNNGEIDNMTNVNFHPLANPV
jgi:hypothetical protein